MNSSLPYDPFHPPGATRTFTFVPDYPGYREQQQSETGTPVQRFGSAVTPAPDNQGKAVPILFPVASGKQSAAATPNFAPAFAPPAARREQLQSFG